jgi:hypothetical protein
MCPIYPNARSWARQVAAAAGAFLKKLGDAALPSVQVLLPTYTKLLSVSPRTVARPRGVTVVYVWSVSRSPPAACYYQPSQQGACVSCLVQESGRTDEERRIAVCLLDDLVENSPTGLMQFFDMVCVWV